MSTIDSGVYQFCSIVEYEKVQNASPSLAPASEDLSFGLCSTHMYRKYFSIVIREPSLCMRFPILGRLDTGVCIYNAVDNTLTAKNLPQPAATGGLF